MKPNNVFFQQKEQYLWNFPVQWHIIKNTSWTSNLISLKSFFSFIHLFILIDILKYCRSTSELLFLYIDFLTLNPVCTSCEYQALSASAKIYKRSLINWKNLEYFQFKIFPKKFHEFLFKSNFLGFIIYPILYIYIFKTKIIKQFLNSSVRILSRLKWNIHIVSLEFLTCHSNVECFRCKPESRCFYRHLTSIGPRTINSC